MRCSVAGLVLPRVSASAPASVSELVGFPRGCEYLTVASGIRPLEPSGVDVRLKHDRVERDHVVMWTARGERQPSETLNVTIRSRLCGLSGVPYSGRHGWPRCGFAD